jgi:hypothetical protein
LFNFDFGSFFSDFFNFDVFSVKGWSDGESFDLEFVLVNEDASEIRLKNYPIPFSPQSSPQLFSTSQQVCPSLTSQPMILTA